jgi:hypothetical protein
MSRISIRMLINQHSKFIEHFVSKFKWLINNILMLYINDFFSAPFWWAIKRTQ